MTVEEQIANLNLALDKELDNRKKGYMRLQLRNLEFRLDKLRDGGR